MQLDACSRKQDDVSIPQILHTWCVFLDFYVKKAYRLIDKSGDRYFPCIFMENQWTTAWNHPSHTFISANENSESNRHFIKQVAAPLEIQPRCRIHILKVTWSMWLSLQCHVYWSHNSYVISGASDSLPSLKRGSYC